MIEKLNAIGISDAMITSTVITVIICVLAIIAGRRIEMIPSGFQNMVELGIEKLHGFFEGIMGKYACDKYFPLIATLFIYILFCNYSGLIPGSGDLFTVPTSVLTVTAALSTISFVAIQSSGIKKHGLGKYLGTFFKPFAFLFPILILEQFTRPLSMALRLYGNIYGEELAAETLFELFPVGLPIVMHILSLLFCFIQAMVFTMLLAVFINEATEDEE